MDSWQYTASIAPIGTAIIATLALCVALVSLQAQKGVARRRASIDFFLKTEMDEKLLEAYSKYRKGVEQLESTADLPADFYPSEHYTNVRGYLNILELMAVGIENNTFDERICYVYWCEFLLGEVQRTSKLIDHIRSQPGGRFYYRALLQTYDRWLNNPELPLRWNYKSEYRGPIQLTARP